MREEAANAYCKLRYCKKCQYVWEKGYCISNRMTKVYKYRELCSYKLKRENCIECERSNDGENNINRRTNKFNTQYC